MHIKNVSFATIKQQNEYGELLSIFYHVFRFGPRRELLGLMQFWNKTGWGKIKLLHGPRRGDTLTAQLSDFICSGTPNCGHQIWLTGNLQGVTVMLGIGREYKRGILRAKGKNIKKQDGSVWEFRLSTCLDTTGNCPRYDGGWKGNMDDLPRKWRPWSHK
eukprot:253508_1